MILYTTPHCVAQRRSHRGKCVSVCVYVCVWWGTNGTKKFSAQPRSGGSAGCLGSEAQHPFVSSRHSEAYWIMGAENKTELDFCFHLAFLSKNPNRSGLNSTRQSKKEKKKKNICWPHLF